AVSGSHVLEGNGKAWGRYVAPAPRPRRNPAGHPVIAGNDVERGAHAVLEQQREHLRVVVQEPVVEGEAHTPPGKVAPGFEQRGDRDRAVGVAADGLEVMLELRERERLRRRTADGMIVEDRGFHRVHVARSRNSDTYCSPTRVTA